MTEPTPDEEIRDFTLPMKPHKFKIDDDIFAALAVISPVTLQRLAGLHATLGGAGADTTSAEGLAKMLTAVGDIFKMMLPGASGQRFAARLAADGTQPDLQVMATAREISASSVAGQIAEGRISQSEIVYIPPIDLTRQAIPALYWLLERYGLRPTEQSSPLPSDSGTGDSTDGAPETAPTGEASLELTNS